MKEGLWFFCHDFPIVINLFLNREIVLVNYEITIFAELLFYLQE
jgi:hypothetical protein